MGNSAGQMVYFPQQIHCIKERNKWRGNSVRIQETSETHQPNAVCGLCLDPDSTNCKMTFLRHLGETEYRWGVG